MSDNSNGQAAQTNQAVAIRKMQEETVGQVLAKIKSFIETGDLRLPKDYSPENAIRSAYLVLLDHDKKPLENCTKESVCNALFKMTVLGLSPMKKQCDFIPYGTILKCNESYAGNIALAKRYGGLKRIKANAIFAGDVFEFEVGVDGRRKIIKHTQTMESFGTKDLKGAYAICEMEDGTFDVEIMNMIQIRDAWNQGPMKGNSPAHKNFPDQMACKTVINRACKLLIRSSDDSVLMLDDDNDTKDITAESVKTEIKANANKTEIGINGNENMAGQQIKNTEPVSQEPELVDESNDPGY